jgi:hypothetical protein
MCQDILYFPRNRTVGVTDSPGCPRRNGGHTSNVQHCIDVPVILLLSMCDIQSTIMSASVYQLLTWILFQVFLDVSPIYLGSDSGRRIFYSSTRGINFHAS